MFAGAAPLHGCDVRLSEPFEIRFTFHTIVQKGNLMKRQERDFVALFNAFWYRDFPITKHRVEISRRALWTTHIASTVKQCADHLGLFTCFETGGKTDAVIEYADAKKWAKIEWEWLQPAHEKVNEIEKLAAAALEDVAEVFIFIGYSNTANHDENIEAIHEQWKNIDKPLIAFIVTFSKNNGKREFELLQTHFFSGKNKRMLRKQKALPWEVNGTKWQAQANMS